MLTHKENIKSLTVDMATLIQCSAPSLDVTRYRQSCGLHEHFAEILLTICYVVEALSVDMQIYHDYQIT